MDSLSLRTRHAVSLLDGSVVFDTERPMRRIGRLW